MGHVSNFTPIPEIENRALKVESVSVYEKENETTFIAIAVSDDDIGGSDILVLQLEI